MAENDEKYTTYATLAAIAEECGYASPAGARQAIERAMEKLGFLFDIENELSGLIDKCLDEYVAYLSQPRAGLTQEEVHFLSTNRHFLCESPEFRQRFKKVINREYRNWKETS